MLELRRVVGFYGESRAIEDVSLAVADGELVSVLGRNGVGKTTLLRALMGLLDRTEGSIVLDGRELARLPTHERARAGLGYVPQGRGILPNFTVRENLLLGTFASGRGDGRIEERVLDLFPILQQFLDRRGGDLSGGQQQQLAIARALLSDPKILLLDEPTEGIQPNIVEQIEGVVIELNRAHGIAVVLIEQDVEFARRASHRFVVMERGRIAAQGPIDQLSDELVQRHMAV